MISYAQNFEDVMLWRAVGHVGHGCYIDVGAQDPLVDSVSLAFYERGWRGVHVEPTAAYAQALRLARPDETVLQAAVGTATGLMPFYEIERSGISTGDAAIATRHAGAGFAARRIDVPCIRLSEVLDRHSDRDVHWLKIDVEGMERSVLESWLPSPVRPWIVVVESTLPLSKEQSHADWEALILAQGYSFRHFDGLNRFYVAEHHRELFAAFETPPNVFDGFVLSGTANHGFCVKLNEEVGHYRDELRRLKDHQAVLEERLRQPDAGAHARVAELERRVTEQAAEAEQRSRDALEQARQVTYTLSHLELAKSETVELLKQLGTWTGTHTAQVDAARQEAAALHGRLLDSEKTCSDVKLQLAAAEADSARLAAELASLRDRHALELQQLAQGHEVAREAANVQHATELQQAKQAESARLTAELASLRDRHALELQQLAQGHQVALEAASVEHATELQQAKQAESARLTAELASLRDRHALELQQLAQGHQVALEAASVEHATELQQAKQAESARLTAELASLGDRHALELQQLAQGHQVALEAANVQHATELQQAHVAGEVRATARVQSLQVELDARHADALDAQRHALEHDFKTRLGEQERSSALALERLGTEWQDTFDAQARRLAAEVDAARREAANRETAERERGLAELERVAADAVLQRHRHAQSLRAQWDAERTLQIEEEGRRVAGQWQTRLAEREASFEAAMAAALGAERDATGRREYRERRRRLETLRALPHADLGAELVQSRVQAAAVREQLGRHVRALAGQLAAGGLEGVDGTVARSTLAPAPTPETQEEMAMLDELLVLNDVEFVRAAYRSVLGREADPPGERNYLELLRHGIDKTVLLHGLATSEEAQRNGATLPGLERAMRRRRMRQRRLIGPAMRLFERRGERDATSAFRNQALALQRNALELLLGLQMSTVDQQQRLDATLQRIADRHEALLGLVVDGLETADIVDSSQVEARLDPPDEVAADMHADPAAADMDAGEEVAGAATGPALAVPAPAAAPALAAAPAASFEHRLVAKTAAWTT